MCQTLFLNFHLSKLSTWTENLHHKSLRCIVIYLLKMPSKGNKSQLNWTFIVTCANPLNNDNMSFDSHNISKHSTIFFMTQQLKNNFQQSAINPNVVFSSHPIRVSVMASYILYLGYKYKGTQWTWTRKHTSIFKGSNIIPRFITFLCDNNSVTSIINVMFLWQFAFNHGMDKN